MRQGSSDKTLALLIIAAVMTACAGPNPNVMVGRTGPQGPLATHIAISNPALQRNITLSQAITADRGALLLASVILKSHTRTTQEFEYRFEWYDLDGVQIPDNKSHWRLDRIYGMEEKQLQQIAPDPRARTFKIMLRKPQPVTR